LFHFIQLYLKEHCLDGAKSVQYALTNPGELERFVSQAEALELRTKAYVGLWGLEDPTIMVHFSFTKNNTALKAQFLFRWRNPHQSRSMFLL
jgi:hypothetical protein